MRRNGGEPSFGGSCSYGRISVRSSRLLTTPPRKLEGVITKLEPLADQHAIFQFLCNVDNAKTLTGFIQDIANAITDYQVRANCTTVILDEPPARFLSNKDCTKERGTSVTIPRIFW